MDSQSKVPDQTNIPTETTPPQVVMLPPAPKRRKLLKPALWLIVLLLVAGAGVAWWLTQRSTAPKPATQTKAAYSGPVDKIRIGNVGEYSIFNLIAQQKGYFKEHGLNATITEYPSGPPAVVDLMAGKVDFAVAADFVGVNTIFGQPDLRILAQVSQQDNFRVLARKDKGINNPVDLKGKKVAVTKKGAGEFFLGRFLSLNGLELKDIQEVNLAPADIVSQLTSGQVDAAVIFEPHAYNLTNSLGDKLVSWSAQGGLKTQALIYTTGTYTKAKPEVVNRYMAALVEAEQYRQRNDQGSRAILANSLHYDKAYVDYIWPKIDFSILLDQSLLLAMEDEARFVIDNGGTTQTKVPNYLDNIYFNAIEKAKPDAVEIIH